MEIPLLLGIFQLPPALNPRPFSRISKKQGDLRFRGGCIFMDASELPGAAATYSRRMI